MCTSRHRKARSSAFGLQLAPGDVGMFRIPDPSKASHNNGAATAVCGQPASSGDAILIFLTGEGKATPNGDPAGQTVPTGMVARVVTMPGGSTDTLTIAVRAK